jgi:DNA-binding transcriptional MerR regulator
MDNKRYTIQEISHLTGLSIHTLRYYEQIELLDSVERLDNGHRRYKPTDLTRIEFLKRLRATGMSIKEMQYYVELYRRGDSTLRERRKILQEHRESIQTQLDELLDTMFLIDGKIERYLEQESTLENTDRSVI